MNHYLGGHILLLLLSVWFCFRPTTIYLLVVTLKYGLCAQINDMSLGLMLYQN